MVIVETIILNHQYKKYMMYLDSTGKTYEVRISYYEEKKLKQKMTSSIWYIYKI